MSVRQQPRVGAPVSVVYLGARATGHLAAVEGDGRQLAVLTDEGEVVNFALNPATGHFAADGSQWGARLVFEEHPSGPCP